MAASLRGNVIVWIDGFGNECTGVELIPSYHRMLLDALGRYQPFRLDYDYDFKISSRLPLKAANWAYLTRPIRFPVELGVVYQVLVDLRNGSTYSMLAMPTRIRLAEVDLCEAEWSIVPTPLLKKAWLRCPPPSEWRHESTTEAMRNGGICPPG